jgi:hypothetical protein
MAAAAASCCWCFEVTLEPLVVHMRAPPGMRDDPMQMNICAKCQVVARPLLADKIADSDNVYDFAPDFIVVYGRSVMKHSQEVTYLLDEVAAMLRATAEEVYPGVERVFHRLVMPPAPSTSDATSP